VDKKTLHLVIAISTFFILSSCLLFSFGSGIIAPENSLKSGIPQYPSSQKIEIEQDNLEQIVIDSFGGDYLQYDSQTVISWTEDMVIDVDLFFDEILTDDNWSNESGWDARYHSLSSEWEKEDLKLSIMLLYDLDSESIGMLNNAYGLEGVEPGGTLIFAHVVDLSQASLNTPEKAGEEIITPAITVSDIQSIETSSVAGDPTIWVFLPSGNIAQSDDHGRSWSKVFEPIEFGWSYLMDAGSSIQFTKSGHGLFITHVGYGIVPFLWYTESTTWNEISLPEDTASVAVAQDGSGRVIAVGANPKGKENAWMLESPDGGWRPIPCEIDNWAKINKVDWSPEYGIVANNSEGTILHADENYQWKAMGTPGTNLGSPNYWVAADGNLYIHGRRDNDLRWNGEKWEEFENNFFNTLGTLSGVADFGTGPDNNMYRSEDAGLTIDVVDVPDMPERIAILGLAVSGDNIVYLVTEAGFYMSRDAGSTWELLIQN